MANKYLKNILNISFQGNANQNQSETEHQTHKNGFIKKMKGKCEEHVEST